MIRVFLADDHPVVRGGLRALIERQPGFEVAGEAADGREAIEWLSRQTADVAVLDVAMPGLSGIEAAARIAREWPRVAIVMLSMHSDETYVLRCLRAGARAYVLKEAAEGELIFAIRAASAGKTYFSPKVKRLLERGHASERSEPLTEREREIVALIAEGNSNKEIAARLSLSVYTVETHRKNVLEKLRLRGTAELVLYAVRRGLVAS